MDNAMLLEKFQKVMQWISNNSIPAINGEGIAVFSGSDKIYPEVTGYYIPTLLQWGERERAIKYATYLCSIQKEDGSWYDSDDREPYVFDSAQILKGLLAIRKIMPSVDEKIVKGCEWILSNMHEDGRLTTPNKDAWGNDESFCSELVHIYCLSPIKEAGVIFDRPDFIEKADKILAYYKVNKEKEILNFSLLSHFYAYVMEGLFDMGEIEMCKEAMNRLEKHQNRKGGIPGLKDVPWVCSTGLFQIALVWYKLGELEKGNRIFEYAVSLQNPSGGWYGSYPAPTLLSKFYIRRWKPYYFPKSEISWACKYYLDALAFREKLEFEKVSGIFLDDIGENDGRYREIFEAISEYQNAGGNKEISILDAGAGKGRYLKKLKKDFPNALLYASDISEKVMEAVDCVEDKKIGSLTNIPYDDEKFNIVYTCEALEHAINIEGALKEMWRVLKPNGRIIIIDKPIEKLSGRKLFDYEQWIDDGVIRRFCKEQNGTLNINENVPYEGNEDGLFRAWILRKS